MINKQIQLEEEKAPKKQNKFRKINIFVKNVNKCKLY